jgi:hypothetical protein
VGELDDVQAAVRQVPVHRDQVPDHVVEGEQVAERIQHRDGDIECVPDAKVAHVRLDHVQAGTRRLGLRRRVRAHRRGTVEHRRPQAAARELARVLGRPRGQLEHGSGRPAAGQRAVAGAPGEQGGHLGGDVTVGAGQLVQLWFVINAAHPSNHAAAWPSAGRRAAAGRFPPWPHGQHSGVPIRSHWQLRTDAHLQEQPECGIWAKPRNRSGSL